ncbi:MAG: restriction endonuclease subunit S [Proteobacteria bacterium]|nr:restriction endonuclease subunit S [Pseudomonadota bacterium]
MSKGSGVAVAGTLPTQMKDSALGRIPESWEVLRLEHILDRIEAGKSPSCPDRPAVGEEWGVLKVSAVRPEGFVAGENKAIVNTTHIEPLFEVKERDLLITRANTYELVGLTCLVHKPPPRLMLCDKTLRLVLTEAADRRFIFFASQMPYIRRQIEVHATGSSGSMKNISQETIKGLLVIVPPCAEQRRIAEILDTLDEAIRKTEELIAKLKQVKQGLLHDLLTRGIDDNGELRDPNRHPEQFQDSPLGRIPKAWKVGGLLDVGATDRQSILTGPFGAQLGSSDFRSSGVPLLRIGNVQWGYLDLADLVHVSESKAQSLARYRVRKGDLLFARQGATTGRNALADARTEEFLINYHIIRVAVEHSRCHPTFLYSVFNSPVIQQQVDREKGRSTREGVSTGTLTSLRFPIPRIEEQSRFANVVEAHDARTQQEALALEKLKLLKQGLMEDLLTGRVRTTNLEAGR